MYHGHKFLSLGAIEFLKKVASSENLKCSCWDFKKLPKQISCDESKYDEFVAVM